MCREGEMVEGVVFVKSRAPRRISLSIRMSKAGASLKARGTHRLGQHEVKESQQASLLRQEEGLHTPPLHTHQRSCLSIGPFSISHATGFVTY